MSKTALGVVSGLRLSLRVIYSETEITEVVNSVSSDATGLKLSLKTLRARGR